MRTLSQIMDFNADVIGTMSTNGTTACGVPVDTLGFKEVLAVIMANSVVGSNPNYMTFDLQECATLSGTGTAWSTIQNGQLMGTCTGTIPFLSGTDPRPANLMMYERLQDGTRLRYLRLRATFSGTTGCAVRFAGGLLLGTPMDTLYVTNASPQATGPDNFNLAI